MDARGRPLPFRDLLRQHRIAAGLSQERLAERSGLSVRAISDLERGARRAPRLETVRMLADALGLDQEQRVDLLRAARAGNVMAPASADARFPTSWPRLPIPPTPLVGREREIANLLQLLASDAPRLITLTGTGGVGKTRLAIKTARCMAEQFDDGVLFVELAPIREPGLVARAIADVLDVAPAPGVDPVTALARSIGERHLLLILDNFEHVALAAPVVAGLLARCPALRVLVTSRAPLGLRGERQFPVPALQAPGTHQMRLDDMLRADAMRLFVERARDARPDFVLDEESAIAVAAICRRLDGIPLALELAAVRLKMLPPSTLLARLERSLALLTGGAIDLPARHRTLRATIAWSHDLLECDERIVFRRLAVFAGGWTLESAEQVVDPEGGIDVLEALASLINKNMVRTQEGPGAGVRYRMLETIREFALERLQESDELETIGERHARYFLRLAQAGTADLADAEVGGWLSRLEADQANMRAALIWFRDRALHAPGLRLATALGPFWRLRSTAGEGRGWLEMFLQASTDPDIAAPERLAGMKWIGELAALQGDHGPAQAWLNKSLALARDIGDEEAAAAVLGALGSLTAQTGDVAASIPLFEQGAAISRRLGNDRQAVFSLAYLAIAVAHQGDLPRALSVLDEARALVRSLGDLRSFEADFVLMVEGWIAYLEGNPDAARRAFASGLALGEEIDAKAIVATILAGMGEVAMMQGDLVEAAACYREGIEAGSAVGFPPGVVFNVQGLARVASCCGRPAIAARLSGVVDGFGTAIRTLPGPGLREYQASTEQVRDALGDAAFAAERVSGTGLTPAQLVELARAVEGCDPGAEEACP